MWKKSGRSPISQLRSFKVNSKRLNAVISREAHEVMPTADAFGRIRRLADEKSVLKMRFLLANSSK